MMAAESGFRKCGNLEMNGAFYSVGAGTTKNLTI